MTTLRLTAAQALVRWLAAQRTEFDGQELPLFGGVWAIFGHGNVAGLGEALWQAREVLPTFRAHNEQAMALAAIGFAKACGRRRMMACTSSIGPGATNMVTAAAVAHVNRLPLLLLPGDVFANRRPDPVLQQIEDFGDGTVSANDCFRPVSRYFDRITRPEQLLTALPQALRVLTDPAECGPVTLAFCQDVQTEALDWPATLFEPHRHQPRRPAPDAAELRAAIEQLRRSRRPFVIAGGGIHYAGATAALGRFATMHRLPVAETMAGKGTLPFDHPQAAGPLGVTGGTCANTLLAEADLVLAIGTRLQDFTSGSGVLLKGRPLIQLNVQAFDVAKHGARPLVGDALRTLELLDDALQGWSAEPAWTQRAATLRAEWEATVERVTAPTNAPLPSDAQALGAVNRACGRDAVVLHAAGGLPGELHKLWRTGAVGGFHSEYGYSTMGYEIAGGLGAKLARPERELVVMLGDGSYLMMNSEIATSVMLGLKLTIVVLDNRGFGCIDRLQRACGGVGFNNLLDDVTTARTQAPVDFVAHARALGALAEKAASLAELEDAVRRAAAAERTTVIVCETDPRRGTAEGGAWWDVAVPEVSERPEVQDARAGYEAQLRRRDRELA